VSVRWGSRPTSRFNPIAQGRTHERSKREASGLQRFNNGRYGRFPTWAAALGLRRPSALAILAVLAHFAGDDDAVAMPRWMIAHYAGIMDQNNVGRALAS
jgi:hypothetical protein